MARAAWVLSLSVLSVVLLPRSAAAESTALLPGISVRLKAARYSSNAEEFRWTGWVGAGAGLARVEGVTAYLTGDVETVVGSEQAAFDARQANYTIELGASRRLGRVTASVLFHHVSRHVLGRPKEQAVDWNIVGVRASTHRRKGRSLPFRISAGIGHTTQVSLVGYRWEMTGRVEADLVRRRWGTAYLLSDARAVTTTRTEAFPRSGFVDVAVEGGLRWSGRAGSLGAFLAYEHRNDVFLVAPGSSDRALFGVRIGHSDAAEIY